MGSLKDKWRKDPESYRRWYFNWSVGCLSGVLARAEAYAKISDHYANESKETVQVMKWLTNRENFLSIGQSITEENRAMVNLWRLDKKAAYAQYGHLFDPPALDGKN